MPEGYTHVRTAHRGLQKSGVTISNTEAFGAGTNGPDPLFFYKAWVKNPEPNLYALGSKMHKENTGQFLLCLLQNAHTPTQKSYVAGFLTHYATDKLAHPYVAYLTRNGGPYDFARGHHFYESELSSALHYLDYGTTSVAPQHTMPLPDDAKLLQICDLLHACILQVYRENIAIDDLMKSFHHIRLVRSVLRSNNGIRRIGFEAIEKYVLHSPGYIVSLTTPVSTKVKVPDEWFDEFDNNRKHTGGMPKILAKAARDCSKFIQMAEKYWNGEISLDDCGKILGNKSYETGQEIKEV